MFSRVSFGSVRTFLGFVACVLVFGIVVALDKGSGLINRVIQLLWLTFVIGGSATIFLRMWQARGNPGEFRKMAHSGRVGILPPGWRR
jgi:putative exporter of polyketide antibiotics